MANAELTSTAQRRHTDPAQLNHLLRGDLDWIVMKCLEKDRTRRYDTANGLAMDIQRHLANEPVVARPPSPAYKIHKGWQRNKIVFTSAAIVFLTLLIGSGVSTWQAVRATRARTVAQTKQKEAEQEKQRADREATSAKLAYTTAQRVAYSARMLVAQADWDNSNFQHLRDILAETETYPDRRFE